MTAMKPFAHAAIALLALSGCSSDPASSSGGDGGNTGSTGNGAGGTNGTTSGTGAGGTTTGTGPSACDNIAGEGYTLGQINEDWTLPDHLGGMVNLHQFCGKPTYMEISSMW
jgi:hypothetical protein